MNNNKGFTLIEMMVVIAIMTVLATLVLPDFLGLTQKSRLRKAARDVYSSMQTARMGAIQSGFGWDVRFRKNQDDVLIFNPGPDGIMGGDGKKDDVKTFIELADYKNVKYGLGNFGPIPDGKKPGDGISFGSNRVTFQSDGTANKAGTVYLTTDSGEEAYAISVLFTTGRIKFWKNSGAGWEG